MYKRQGRKGVGVTSLLLLFYLIETEFQRSLAVKDSNNDFEFVLILSDLLNDTGESAEGTIGNLHFLALEIHILELQLHFGSVHLTNEFVDFRLGDGSRLDAALAFGEESQDIGDVAQERIALVAEIAFHEDIARQDVALFDDCLLYTSPSPRD